MDQSVKTQNFRLLQTAKRLNEQYHIYAVSRGLSDPAANILYTLMEPDGVITQNDLAIMWCYPKQTVNFTIQGLVKKGYVQLEQLPGGRNRKSVSLTAQRTGLLPGSPDAPHRSGGAVSSAAVRRRTGL